MKYKATAVRFIETEKAPKKSKHLFMMLTVPFSIACYPVKFCNMYFPTANVYELLPSKKLKNEWQPIWARNGAIVQTRGMSTLEHLRTMFKKDDLNLKVALNVATGRAWQLSAKKHLLSRAKL